MALGYQNHFYLKQAQQKQQSLYNGKVLLEKHDPPAVYDLEETLQLAQESRLKMKQLNKEIKPANYTKINHLSGVFVYQMAKSREELYFSNTSKTASVSKPISIPYEEFSDDTTPSVARKFLNKVKSTIVTLQRVVKQKMTLDIHNWSSSVHQEIHKIVKDEIFLIVNQVDARLQNFEIQFLKEATKFVRDFKYLANEADESLAKHKALELEIERLLRAVISQDIMSIVQNPSVVDSSNLQTELERTKERFENCIIKKENEYAKLRNDWYKKCEECKYDKISYDKAYNDMQQKIERLQAQLGDQKGKSKDTPCVSNTLDPLSQKLENENVELEFQVRNYEKEIAHLKTTYKNLFDSISVTRAQTKTIIDSLQNKLHDTIYENAKFDKVSEQVDTTKGTSTNTKFANQSTERKPSLQPVRKNLVVRQPNAFQSEHTTSSKNRVPQKVDETNDLSKPVTSNSVPTPQESKNVIAPGMFRINPFKPSREEKYVPNKVRASGQIRSLFHNLMSSLRKNVNYDSNGFSSTGVDNIARPEATPRAIQKNVIGSPLHLEVAFRRNICFVRNLEGVNLLKDNRTTNLYTINLHEMASASPICLMARATSKSWLWHQRLSYLNFDTIHDLAKNDLVIGLPKFKYHKDILCQSVASINCSKAMHDDYIGGQPSAAPRTVSAAQSPQVLQTLTETTTTKSFFNSKRLDYWVLVPLDCLVMEGGTPRGMNRFHKESFASVSRWKLSDIFAMLHTNVHVFQMDVKTCISHVKKALYGLKQAPRAWYDKLSTFLLQNHFFKGTIDLTLFIRCFDDKILVAKSTEKHLNGGVKTPSRVPSGGAPILREKAGLLVIKKIKSVRPLSTAKAEYVSLSAYCSQVLWMRT
ncbi:retrovirus-related pol polyprotein from transposon TNT 1-94 [Tanacetum coccineum]